LYLWDLPEPLIRLSLREFRQYGQNKAEYTENDFSLLQSVIRELPPVHRETLGKLSRHLSRVASHSAQNGMPAKALASQFCYAVFRGNTIVEGYVYLKACCVFLFSFSLLIFSGLAHGGSHSKCGYPV
ncbi:Rho GTPase activation protein, partial [Lactarius akahatsu]